MTKSKNFKSYMSYYSFSESIQRNRRYILDKDSNSFLSTVLATAKTRTEVIKKGSIAFRSQSGCEYEEQYDGGILTGERPVAYSRNRMLTLKNSAKEGRANSKGIPVLYLSNDIDTALSESRPWLQSYISLAHLKITSDQKIIKCLGNEKSGKIYFKEPNPSKREDSVWYSIDSAFSRPIQEKDNTAYYAPTQILAELFKTNGYDGIAYRSSLGKGYNITLFDPNCVEIKRREVYTTKSLGFEFDQVG